MFRARHVDQNGTEARAFKLASEIVHQSGASILHLSICEVTHTQTLFSTVGHQLAWMRLDIAKWAVKWRYGNSRGFKRAIFVKGCGKCHPINKSQEILRFPGGSKRCFRQHQKDSQRFLPVGRWLCKLWRQSAASCPMWKQWVWSWRRSSFERLGLTNLIPQKPFPTRCESFERRSPSENYPDYFNLE